MVFHHIVIPSSCGLVRYAPQSLKNEYIQAGQGRNHIALVCSAPKPERDGFLTAQKPFSSIAAACLEVSRA